MSIVSACESYVVTCLQGHLCTPKIGTDLEELCIQREKRGFLDALTLTAAECPICVADDQMKAERNGRRCGQAGCAMGNCGDGPCQMACAPLNSVYEGQISWLRSS